MGGPGDGWEEQRLVLGVGEYRARHRRAAPARRFPDVHSAVPPLPSRSLRSQVERVLLLFDQVPRPALRSSERPPVVLAHPLQNSAGASTDGPAARRSADDVRAFGCSTLVPKPLNT